jgi:uncharacterized BrkB/YihY/UPF0761 family membrane protein
MIALVCLYYSSWIFVYGGELNAAIARVREAKARFGPAVRAGARAARVALRGRVVRVIAS